jgi:hypothetical protein
MCNFGFCKNSAFIGLFCVLVEKENPIDLPVAFDPHNNQLKQRLTCQTVVVTTPKKQGDGDIIWTYLLILLSQMILLKLWAPLGKPAGISVFAESFLLPNRFLLFIGHGLY